VLQCGSAYASFFSFQVGSKLSMEHFFLRLVANVAHMFCWGATEHFTITVHKT